MAQYLFVVAQDKPDLCDYLRGWFSGIPTVRVMLDRRQAERRRRAEANEPGRRRVDRRTQKEIEAEIRQTGFAIIGNSSS
ncbi:MAG: hypothetical protein HYV92_00820 [Candidatus Rokubacteria bacterium]|nr:hypothetical protein [Candidatus Rokubacteria bacterium]MBI2544450.1 hypothetical protein [Candidatus Rokubacteria bacterium]MBI2552985.1 hypothetical protein [Candidatus Rokubacteria bacterium]